MVGRRTVIIGPCGSSGGGGLATNNCCGTIYQAGSVDLDGLEWATDYTITLAAPIGTVTVTDQGSGTWESDAIDVTCTVDEVTVTDEYTVTMTATGNAPGEVVVTVALMLGGGYGGASGCCETTEGGFAWKYVNCCLVDPLAGWSMTRDPSGFSGKECEIGGCEICVTPTPESILCGSVEIPSRVFEVNLEITGDLSPLANDYFLFSHGGCEAIRNFYHLDDVEDTAYVQHHDTPGTVAGRDNEISGLSNNDVNALKLHFTFYNIEFVELSIRPAYYNGSTYSAIGVVIYYAGFLSHPPVITDGILQQVTLLRTYSSQESIWPASEWPESIVISPREDMYA